MVLCKTSLLRHFPWVTYTNTQGWGIPWESSPDSVQLCKTQKQGLPSSDSKSGNREQRVPSTGPVSKEHGRCRNLDMICQAKFVSTLHYFCLETVKPNICCLPKHSHLPSSGEEQQQHLPPFGLWSCVSASHWPKLQLAKESGKRSLQASSFCDLRYSEAQRCH